MKRTIFAVAVLLLFAGAPAAWASVPYDTYTKDAYGRALRTPPAYEPTAVYGGDIYLPDADAGGGVRFAPLKSPKDLFVDKDDRIYVADTDNNRIVVFDADGRFDRVVAPEKDPLNRPQGVFVSEDGAMYVADTGNRRIVRIGRDGAVERSFGRPAQGLPPDSGGFEPTNVVVDKRGFLYAVLNGSFQGVMQLDPEGEFRGFFGTNATEAGWMDRVRRLLYTKEQLSRQVRLLPATIRNIDIDELGYIYTVSGSGFEQLKKLNVRGDNLWGGRSFGEAAPAAQRQGAASGTAGEVPRAEPLLTDVAVDRSGNATLIDKTGNVVLQYDAEGRLLFYWAGPVTAGMPRVGLNQSPVAVAVNSRQQLLVLDEALNAIQVFSPTQFGTAVHAAHGLTRDGKYEESRVYWQEVAKLDALYPPAYRGLADAAFYKGDYAEAMRLYRLAGDSTGYSDAVWQLRLIWFQSRFPWIANACVFVFLVWLAAGRINRRFGPALRQLPGSGFRRWRRSEDKRLQLPAQLRQAFVILRHPLDGFGDLRYANKGSWLSGFVILAAVAAALLARSYYTSFTFHPVPAEMRSGGTTLLVFGAVWFTWVVCNYLIGSIYRGEARFKDVFIGSAYSLFPAALLGLPLALLSHALTLQEASIYHTVAGAVVVWCGLLFFWNIQSLQNYGVGETAASVCLTVVSMMMLWVLLFILFGLSTDLLNFIKTIYLEVSM